MSTTATTEPLLTPEQVADILNVTPGTLNVWRCTRRYPLPFVKVGQRVRYRRADLEQFIALQTVAGCPAD